MKLHWRKGHDGTHPADEPPPVLPTDQAPELAAGRAALFALVADPDWERVRQALAPYGGEVVATEVSDEVVEALAARGPEP